MNLTWHTNDLQSVLPVLLSLVCFVVYWFVSQSENIKASYYKKYSYDEASLRHIFFTKIFGFLAMGIVPLIICMLVFPEWSLASYGITLIPQTNLFTLLWILGLGGFVVVLTYLNAGKEEDLANYPQVRAKVWTNRTVLIYASGWTLYLLGYELLFRGVLFLPLVNVYGLWPAIAINIAMYSATHIPKGLKETIGAIPFGLVICLLTIYSGTIWIAFFVHLIMALTNSFASLSKSKELHYKPNRK